MTDPRIAYPGDPDLDCHLAGLRLASVITSDSDEYTVEAVLSFDTADAGGWWIDSVTGRQVYPDSAPSLTSAFALAMKPGWEKHAQWQLGVLCGWQRHGTRLEMTSAPGKWTRIHGYGLTVVIPRTTEPARLSEA